MRIEKHQRKSQRWLRRGVVLIWVALCGLLFIGFVGLAMDTSHVYSAGQQLQATADAASLAGARYVKTSISGAQDAAVNTGLANYLYGTSSTGTQLDRTNDIIIGRFDRDSQVFTATNSRPNAVRVIARRTAGSANGALDMVFARSFGVATSDVTRDAIASQGAGMGPGVIVLNHTAPRAFRMDGGAVLNVAPAPPETCEDGAGVFVNSNAGNAADIGGGATITATGVWINGGYNGNTGAVTEGSCGSAPGSTLVRQNTCLNSADPGCFLPDPLAGVPEPITPATDFSQTLYGGKAAKIQNSDVVVLDPGYYSKGINCTGGSLILKPGVYILGGSPSPSQGATGLSMSGGSSLCAKGVMLFIKGPYGVLDLEGTGNCSIQPIDLSQGSSYFCSAAFLYPTPAPDSSYQGLAVFQARDNTNASTVNGSSGFDLRGTYYYPAAQLNVSGTAFNHGVQLIADTLWLHGTANVTINYDGRNQGVASNSVFLVE